MVDWSLRLTFIYCPSFSSGMREMEAEDEDEDERGSCEQGREGRQGRKERKVHGEKAVSFLCIHQTNTTAQILVGGIFDCLEAFNL